MSDTKTPRRMHIVHIVSIGCTARNFLGGHFRYLRSQGHDVTLICSDDEDARACAAETGAQFRPVRLQRAISPMADLASLLRMRRALLDLKPDVVHAHTPKGGLIGMAAARLARIPVRIYTIHGFVFDTRGGWSRRLLVAAERFSCRVAKRVLCVSPSLMRRAIDEKICPAEKIAVLKRGSISGVDMDRFSRTPTVESRARGIREEFRIPSEAKVVGFVGRLVRDKGIEELAAAWSQVSAERPDAHLLLVGPWEPRDPPSEATRRILEQDPRVHLAGWQTDVVPYLATMSLLVLPSYREGFGMSIIEAAAMGVPAIATRISGCVDAIEEGVTGLIVPPRDAPKLAEAILQLLRNSALRVRLGEAARERASQDFQPEAICAAHDAEYVSLLEIRAAAT